MQIKGGDCEDLAIFLISLLENIGIKTYLVLTDTHAYCLVYDVDTDVLRSYIEPSLIQQVEKDSGDIIKKWYNETFNLPGYDDWYYGGNGTLFNNTVIEYLNISYDIISNEPLWFYVVPSKDDYYLFHDGNNFTFYTDYEKENVLNFSGVSPYLDQDGGIILYNDNEQDATITVKLMFYLHPSFYELCKNESITSYKIDDKNCVVLDPTAGVYGYPGFDANLTGEKIAIDPVTKEYYYLE
jgi:hypothetical protein